MINVVSWLHPLKRRKQIVNMRKIAIDERYMLIKNFFNETGII